MSFNTEVSLFQERPVRGVPLYSLQTLQTCATVTVLHLNPCLMTMKVSNPRAALIQILAFEAVSRVGSQRLSRVSIRRKTASCSEISFSRVCTSWRILSTALALCVCVWRVGKRRGRGRGRGREGKGKREGGGRGEVEGEERRELRGEGGKQGTKLIG